MILLNKSKSSAVPSYRTDAFPPPPSALPSQLGRAPSNFCDCCIFGEEIVCHDIETSKVFLVIRPPQHDIGPRIVHESTPQVKWIGKVCMWHVLIHLFDLGQILT